MIVYLDTSCLVALAFQESGFKLISQKLKLANDVFSHHLLEAEFLATARREQIGLDLFTDLLAGVRLIYPEQSFAMELKTIFSHDYLRGPDAMHLATAMWLAGGQNKEVHFLTRDEKQAAIGRKLGFVVA